MILSVTIACSDRRSHIWPKLERWCETFGYSLCSELKDAAGGDLLILISCTEIATKEVRERYKKVLVIHESALPAGRGWSPMAWQILEGKNEITISLLEAADKVDSGDIWKQEKIVFRGDELSEELNAIRDPARMRLAQWAIDNFGCVSPRKQAGQPTYYGRRTPSDSRIDPNKSIADQFDLLRICEARFPAFFFHRGARYEIELRKTA